MNFYAQAYYSAKANSPDDIVFHESIRIIELFSELKETVSILGHTVEPLDTNHDFGNLDKPQRLKVHLRVALPKEVKGFVPGDYVDEISSILALITGRIVRTTDQLVVSLPSEQKIYNLKSNWSVPHHPLLTHPLQVSNIQSKIDMLITALLSVKTKDDYKKYSAIIRSMRLYRDSLILLAYDMDTAYVLLVAAGETLGKEFSKIQPVFEKDCAQAKGILALIDEYSLPNDFTEKIKALILKPEHLKLQAKFIDIIIANLDDSFWQSPPILLTPLVKRTPEGEFVEIQGWSSGRSAPWTIQKNQAEEALRNAYRVRSSFVHQGDELPSYIKANPSFDSFRPLKIDKTGNPIKEKNGEFKLKDLIPSYFWMERVINRVLHNQILKFGGLMELARPMPNHDDNVVLSSKRNV